MNDAQGTISLTNSTVSGNTGQAAGGGIANYGTATLTTSTISGNNAQANGGILNAANRTLTITNSTISGNAATQGDAGGIYNSGGTVNLTNSTVSNNSSTQLGGNIYTGGGPSAVVTLRSSIIANGVANGGGPDLLAIGNTTVNSEGYNLIEVANNATITETANPGTDIKGKDPNLGPLQNNGGPTQTHALNACSLALDNGKNFSGSLTDQRGLTRTVDASSYANAAGGDGTDIGAFEEQQPDTLDTTAPTVTINQASGQADPTGSMPVNFTVVFSESVSNFATGDVTLSGTAGTTTATVTGSGTTYNVAVSGATSSGTVIAKINAGVATDCAGNQNLASTSTDNTVTFTAPLDHINIVAGHGQSTKILTSFATALQAVAQDQFGNPIVNATITFTAPASGASGTFANGTRSTTALTNSSGIATASTFTANSFVGGYFVTASNGSASNTFFLTNTKGDPTITFGAAPTPTFGGGNFTVSANTTNTDSSTLTYSRVSGPCAFVSGSTFSSTGAGTCVVQAAGAATTNFNAASNTQSVTIAKASQTITFGALANKTAGDPDFTVSATASSTLTVSFTASGQCTISGNTVHLTGSGSCTITAAQAGDANYNAATNVPQTFSINAQGAVVSFSASNYNTSESTGFVTLTVNRSGDTTTAVTVDYATSDTGTPANCATFNGLASSHCDFTTAIGTVKFAAGETQKTIVVVVNKDSYVEIPNEVFNVNLSNLTGGAAFATPSSATVTITDSAAPAPNAIDDTDTFVRQQYHDFLNREPDASGLAFWKGEIDNCTPKPQCTGDKRVNVSAAFFLSIEFQQSGGLVRDFFVAALDRPLTNNMPNYAEFIRDAQAVQRGIVVGQGSWQADLDANRSAFMNAFVTRAEFVGLYPTTDTPTQYVDKLIAHAALTPTAAERNAAIAEFGAAITAADPGARGRALLRITQNTAFQQREINRAFVHMQYLGYLRRDPNAAPDSNFNGYNFWLAKLIQFNGNYIQAEMVKAFINSGEYRGRFGP